MKTILALFLLATSMMAQFTVSSQTTGFSIEKRNLTNDYKFQYNISMSTGTNYIWYQVRFNPIYSMVVSPAEAIVQPNSIQNIGVTINNLSQLSTGTHPITVTFINVLTNVSVSHTVNLTILGENQQPPIQGNSIDRVAPIQSFTELILVNKTQNQPTNTSNIVSLNFLNSFGQPMQVNINGVIESTHTLTIPAHTVRRIELLLIPDMSGSVLIRDINGTTSLIVQNGPNTIFPARALSQTHVHNVFSHTDIMYIGNFNPSTQTVFLTFRNYNGSIIGFSTLTLNPRTRKIFTLSQEFPYLINSVGSVLVHMNQPGLVVYQINSTANTIISYE
jgi:hypothetical protein